MFTLLALAIVTLGGRSLVKLYGRHLDTQAGPWMAGEMQLQRIQSRYPSDRR